MDTPTMLLTRLQWLLTAPTPLRDVRRTLWFRASIAAAMLYAALGLWEAFSSAYVIHDDVRSHVFWMWRFLEPSLFPKDLIADYFQSVAPHGYTALYRIAAALGVDPLTFNKLLPLPIALVTTAYCFWLTLSILPVPAAGFLASTLLNQAIWNTHDVASATPRAFIYPFFLAFLYYVVKGSLLPALVSVVLQGLFYPQCLFLSSGVLVLRLVEWRSGRPRLSRDRQNYLFCAAGLGVVFVMLLPYALKISDYGPVLTVAEAKTLPTLEGDGRKNFFFDNPFKFWLCGERSGILPYSWCKYERPPELWASLALPVLLWRSRRRLSRQNGLGRSELAQEVTPHVALLLQVVLASVGMFFLAHALLFRLHLPSRYMKHSVPMAATMAAGVSLVLLLDLGLQWARRRSRQNLAALGVVGLAGLYCFGYPLLMDRYPNPDYVAAQSAPLYDFLASQPQNVLIASLSDEANNIPSLSKRSVLTSSETANPYHLGYYRQIQARTEDLMKAQYSLDPQVIIDFIRTYGVNLWLIDGPAFRPQYIEQNPWLRQIEPTATEAMQRLRQGEQPALQTTIRPCRVFQQQGRIVLDARCVVEQLS
ncbi:MAG: hypothetical protein ACFB4J_08010 [Elainellaceae cyanobacterium]